MPVNRVERDFVVGREAACIHGATMGDFTGSRASDESHVYHQGVTKIPQEVNGSSKNLEKAKGLIMLETMYQAAISRLLRVRALQGALWLQCVLPHTFLG